MYVILTFSPLFYVVIQLLAATHNYDVSLIQREAQKTFCEVASTNCSNSRPLHAGDGTFTINS